MISTTNSLIGLALGISPTPYSDPYGVTPLSNGNYVVYNPDWNTGVGSVTWGNGSIPGGVTGNISSANSLVGSTSSDLTNGYSGDRVGESVTALANGNYVADNYYWNSNAGAITWGSGTTGVTGVVSNSNSLAGTSRGDFVGANVDENSDQFIESISPDVAVLTNGSYVVVSNNWNSGVGAATFGIGTSPLVGTVSGANSLVGSSQTDNVASGGIKILSDGNYVVSSPNWNSNAGAATWGSRTSGVVGTVSAANSLIGFSDTDNVASGGITVLPDGNYVVSSPNWNGNTGAATWGNGATGVAGTISAANSLVGSADTDKVASGGITALSNGNYVVSSPNWSSNAGAATWGNGATGVVGTISAANSLVGSAGDEISEGNNTSVVRALTNGNYVVESPRWNNGVGALTWGNGAVGLDGQVSAANSLQRTWSVGCIYGRCRDSRMGTMFWMIPTGMEDAAPSLGEMARQGRRASFLGN